MIGVLSYKHDAVFRDQQMPANFYAGLYSRTSYSRKGAPTNLKPTTTNHD